MQTIKNALFYIIVILLLAYVLMMAFKPDQLMDYIGFRTFIISSDSMDPVLEVNDLVVVQHVESDEFEIGDIITFKTYLSEIGQYGYVTHNLVGFDEVNGETIFITQGERHYSDLVDSWNDAEGNPIYITDDDIEGRVFFHIPMVGYVRYLITDPVFVGLVLVNGFIVYALFRFLRRNKIEDEEITEETIE